MAGLVGSGSRFLALDASGRVVLAAQIGRWFDPVEFLAEPSILSNDIVKAVEPLLDQPDAARQSMAAYVIVSQNDFSHGSQDGHTKQDCEGGWSTLTQ